MNDDPRIVKLETDLRIGLLNAFRIADRAHILALEAEIDDLRKRIIDLEKNHDRRDKTLRPDVA